MGSRTYVRYALLRSRRWFLFKSVTWKTKKPPSLSGAGEEDVAHAQLRFITRIMASLPAQPGYVDHTVAWL